MTVHDAKVNLEHFLLESVQVRSNYLDRILLQKSVPYIMPSYAQALWAVCHVHNSQYVWLLQRIQPLCDQ